MNHSINVCFSTSDSIISRVVRWFTESEVSHCYISYMDQTLQRVMVMESHWKGFILVPWDIKKFGYRKLVARYSINVPEKQQLDSLHALTFYLGSGYDFFNLIPMAFRRVKKRFENPFTFSDRMICSESVVRFLNGCGATDLPFPHTWAPGDVYNYINQRPELFIRQD